MIHKQFSGGGGGPTYLGTRDPTAAEGSPLSAALEGPYLSCLQSAECSGLVLDHRPREIQCHQTKGTLVQLKVGRPPGAIPRPSTFGPRKTQRELSPSGVD
ncbi:hypothetical protein LB505_003667 [Fusarium chuoi]|nr:hypothetical protein LB505_003667 [Fusarium chuoi]